MSAPAPPIVISMGDPGGIGPEVIVKAIARLRETDPSLPAPIICGDMGLLRATADDMGTPCDFAPWAPGEPLPSDAAAVVEVSHIDTHTFTRGRVQAENGLFAVAYLQRAVACVRAGDASALVTAPLNKAALAMAGVEFPGHTEMLAEWAGVSEFAMMLAGPRLRVAPVTRHVPLRDIFLTLTPEAVLSTIKLCADALTTWFGCPAPRLAVAGIDPHAGDGGTLGSDDHAITTPAVDAARAAGIDATGPVSPDAVYMQAADGRYDAVVAPYHDQALIPLKLLHFEDGVNITLGLPYVRTSPDHGTAFDLVGRNCASPSPMMAALRMAWDVAARAQAHTT